MIKTQDVIDAFDSLGGRVNQVQALSAYLENIFPSDEVILAINKAIQEGALVMTDRTGSVRKGDGR